MRFVGLLAALILAGCANKVMPLYIGGTLEVPMQHLGVAHGAYDADFGQRVFVFAKSDFGWGARSENTNYYAIGPTEKHYSEVKGSFSNCEYALYAKPNTPRPVGPGDWEVVSYQQLDSQVCERLPVPSAVVARWFPIP